MHQVSCHTINIPNIIPVRAAIGPRQALDVTISSMSDSQQIGDPAFAAYVGLCEMDLPAQVSATSRATVSGKSSSPDR
jgi:hypothetical protein